MFLLYKGEYKEIDITAVPGGQQILEGLEARKECIGQQHGDFEIISVDYDWGERRQVNIARCVLCGSEKEIPNLRDFVRGKGVARLCRCRYKKKPSRETPYISPEQMYRSYVGQTVEGYRLLDYVKGKGFRTECIECGKQKWITGKSTLSGDEQCNHKIIRNYSDAKYMGMRVGHLTVVGKEGELYRFRCDCGTERLRKPGEVFRNETVKTCGREECPYHKAVQKKGNETRQKGITFEKECARILEGQGITVEMTPESGDFGVDFFANVDGERVAFQCKRLKVSSVVRAVQEVYAGGRYYDCSKFVVVSPSGFTYPSELLASKLGVQLEKDLRDFRLKTLKENKIATQRVQTFSSRVLVWEIDGVTKPAEQWCEEYGISRSNVVSRIKKGMDLKAALKTPKYEGKKMEIEGVLKSKKEWCALYGISPQLFDYRVKYSGLSPKDALTKPKQRN